MLGETNGIDTLLQCVAMYKSRDPQTAEEEEFMQNCFDILCSCLMLQENKAAFVKVRRQRAKGCGVERGGPASEAGAAHAHTRTHAHAALAFAV